MREFVGPANSYGNPIKRASHADQVLMCPQGDVKALMYKISNKSKSLEKNLTPLI
jgi:hypothetical protein